jgi:hypothetical protein
VKAPEPSKQFHNSMMRGTAEEVYRTIQATQKQLQQRKKNPRKLSNRKNQNDSEVSPLQDEELFGNWEDFSSVRCTHVSREASCGCGG